MGSKDKMQFAMESKDEEASGRKSEIYIGEKQIEDLKKYQ